MSNDATFQIIQMIQAQLSQEAKKYWDINNSILGQSDSITSHVADYAQILGSGEVSLVQIGQIVARASAGASAAAEAASLETAAAAATGIGAGIVLFLSFILGSLEASEQSGSDVTQFLQQLGTQVQSIENATLASYWGNKFSDIIGNWDNSAGGLGIDLDNIANEGTAGVDVKNDVSKFHDHAMAFVNLFIPAKTPGATKFWERPAVQDQLFTLATIGSRWYSQYPDPWQDPFPVPPPGPPLGGSDQQMVLDPRSMLPFLLLGIESYLALESLIHFIDSSQPTFTEFLTQFRGDLQEYASFIFLQYGIASNGIIKRKIPTADKLVDYVATATGPVSQETIDNAWTGLSGVVDSYPQFGSYFPSPPVSLPDFATSITYVCSPSYIIGGVRVSTDGGHGMTIPNLYELNNVQASLRSDLINDWIVPWLQDRLILGMMARWKAIYLMNGYDKVWSLIESLNTLANQPPILPLTLDQDGTIASENWSSRELCTILNVNGFILSGVRNNSLRTAAGDYSLFSLVQCLDNIAFGGWGGPPSYSIGPPFVASPGPGPARPLGFRDRLAAAAFPQVPPQSGP